jgi:hypothetical protein
MGSYQIPRLAATIVVSFEAEKVRVKPVIYSDGFTIFGEHSSLEFLP